MDALIGTQIGGKYTLTKFLGEGGLGRVFLATHATIGRTVAIKLLHPALSSDPGISARFALEAKAASKISHPNTVNIHDYGIDNSGPAPQLYLAMEFLQGETLHDRIQQSPEGRLSPEETFSILRQVLKPLAAFHRAGVVHRDLKPDNIMLCQQQGREQVKLLDFGIAKVVGSSLTATGQLLGTPQYMAPEQILAKKEVGPALDVYAVGVILYEALAGNPPYLAESYMDLLKMHLQDHPVPLQQKWPEEPWLVPFDVVIKKAMSHKPEDRYQRVEYLQQALNEALTASLAIELGQEATRISLHPASPWHGEVLPKEEEPTAPLEASVPSSEPPGGEETVRMPQVVTLPSLPREPVPTFLTLHLSNKEARLESRNLPRVSSQHPRATLRKQLHRFWLRLSQWFRKAA